MNKTIDLYVPIKINLDINNFIKKLNNNSDLYDNPMQEKFYELLQMKNSKNKKLNDGFFYLVNKGYIEGDDFSGERNMYWNNRDFELKFQNIIDKKYGMYLNNLMNTLILDYENKFFKNLEEKERKEIFKSVTDRNTIIKSTFENRYYFNVNDLIIDINFENAFSGELNYKSYKSLDNKTYRNQLGYANYNTLKKFNYIAKLKIDLDKLKNIKTDFLCVVKLNTSIKKIMCKYNEYGKGKLKSSEGNFRLINYLIIDSSKEMLSDICESIEVYDIKSYLPFKISNFMNEMLLGIHPKYFNFVIDDEEIIPGNYYNKFIYGYNNSYRFRPYRIDYEETIDLNYFKTITMKNIKEIFELEGYFKDFFKKNRNHFYIMNDYSNYCGEGNALYKTKKIDYIEELIEKSNKFIDKEIQLTEKNLLFTLNKNKFFISNKKEHEDIIKNINQEKYAKNLYDIINY